MKPRTPAVLVLCLCLLTTAASAVAQAPLYTNAQLVSYDARTRTLVVRTNDGRSRTLRLADDLNAPAGLEPGDEVVLGVRGTAGAARVTRLLKSVAGTRAARQAVAGDTSGRTAATSATAVPAKLAPQPEIADGAPAGALATFSDQVATLARQARQVDALWAGFVSTCRASARGRYDRAWFSLWQPDGFQADLTTTYCRDLHNQILDAGEPLKAAMAAAEDQARAEALLPGNIRDVQRRFGMEWDGWARTPPERLSR